MFKVMIPSLMLASIALAQPRDLAPRAGGMLHACVSMFQAPQQFMAPEDVGHLTQPPVGTFTSALGMSCTN